MNDTFEIQKWKTLEMREAKGLSKLQTFICRIFKIPIPLVRYYIEAMVLIDQPDKIVLNNILLIPGGNGCWVVMTKEYSPYIVIQSMDALEADPKYTGESCVIASAFSEREN